MSTPAFNVAVFCGSRPGARPEYMNAARALGTAIAELGGGLVYGGAHVGLMGAVADAALAGGAPVVGVLPRGLADRELAHPRLTELHIVGTLHERKALMASRADGFLALPGGFGTLDEMCEVMTWRQLGLHPHPLGMLDVAGYFESFFAFVDHSVREGFVPAEQARFLLRGSEPRVLLEQMYPDRV